MCRLIRGRHWLFRRTFCPNSMCRPLPSGRSSEKCHPPVFATDTPSLHISSKLKHQLFLAKFLWQNFEWWKFWINEIFTDGNFEWNPWIAARAWEGMSISTTTFMPYWFAAFRIAIKCALEMNLGPFSNSISAGSWGDGHRQSKSNSLSNLP